MKIGVTSQNYRTITGHAGKTRRFLVYQVEQGQDIKELEAIDLPKEMSMHEFSGGEHPIDALDVLITGSCGGGFERKMAQRNIRVIKTGATDPLATVEAFLAGKPLITPVATH